jgi:rare lipoprotein A
VRAPRNRDFVLDRRAALALGSLQMPTRSPAVLLFSALALFSLASCAKKKHMAPAAVSLPQIHAESGLASWYGHPYHGRAAANGEIYDMEKLTAAHRTLPFGTFVRVTNLSNEKMVEVRITDRGPFVEGRIIDLSHAAAQAIDLIGPGVAQVRLDILSLPRLVSPGVLFAAQVGAFRDKTRAEKLRGAMEQEYGSARLVEREDTPGLWRVLVGREPTQQEAEALAARLRSEAGPAFVVRLDEPGPAASAH